MPPAVDDTQRAERGEMSRIPSLATAADLPTPLPNVAIEQGVSRTISSDGIDRADSNVHNGADAHLEPSLTGWPAIALKQSSRPSHSMFRKFDPLAHRILNDQATKICFLRQKLHEHDELDQRGPNPDRLKSLIFDEATLLGDHRSKAQRRPRPSPSPRTHSPTRAQNQENNGDVVACMHDGPCSEQYYNQDPKDCVMEALERRMVRYYKFLFYYSEADKRPQVSRRNYANYCELLGDDLPEGDAGRFMTEDVDDFINIRAIRIHEKFESLLFAGGEPSWFQDLLISCFSALVRYPNAPVLRPGNKSVHPTKLSLLVDLIIALFCTVIMVIPVSILLLGSLSDWQSLVVVIAFSMFVLGCLINIRIGLFQTLLGYCAYFAIMASFLSNRLQISGR